MSNLSSNDSLSREIYQRNRLQETMRRESISSRGGGGGGGGLAYGLFSPTGLKSPFSPLDAQRAFRFDFDDLRTRSNLPSLTQEESEENEDDDYLRQWNEAERRREEEDGARNRRRSELLPELETKRFKLEVLRNILANFSLEKTIEKYRNMSIKQFTLKPSDYSFDCAVPANQLKDKLFRMTGSDQIKINDRHFVKKLQKILETDDQERMQKEFEERSASEYQRLKKLMQQGVIDAKELREHHRLLDRIPEDCGTLTGRSNTRTRRGQNATTTKLSNRSQHQQNKSLVWRSSTMKDSSFSTISSSTIAIIGNQLKSTQSEDNLRLPAITATGSHPLTAKTSASVSSGNLSSRQSQNKKKKKISSTTKAASSSSSAAVGPSDGDSGCTDRPRNTCTAAAQPDDKKLTMVGPCKTSSLLSAALDSTVSCASHRLPRSSRISESDNNDRPLMR